MKRTDASNGDEVIVTSGHVFDGRTYNSECMVGSIGIITDDYEHSEDYVNIKWSSHPKKVGGHPKSGGNPSNIDWSCLELIGPTEAELDAEAAKLFGLQPTRLANHCPTCTCEGT